MKIPFTLQQLEQWNELANNIGRKKPYEILLNNSIAEGIEDVTLWLLENNYIGIMGDGNTFISWTKNSMYPENTIANLKAILLNIGGNA